MIDKGRVSIAVMFGTVVVVLVCYGIAYAKAQYYQGRIDATNDHIRNLEEIRDGLVWVRDKEKGEA